MQVFDALRALMTPPDPPKRPIGFIAPEDKGEGDFGLCKRQDPNDIHQLGATALHEAYPQIEVSARLASAV